MNSTTTTPVLAAADDIHRMLLGLVFLDAISVTLRQAQDCPACRGARAGFLPHREHEHAWAACQAAYDELAIGAGPCVLSPAAAAALPLALRLAAADRPTQHPLDAALNAAYSTLTARLGQGRQS